METKKIDPNRCMLALEDNQETASLVSIRNFEK
jgi:hypothetical protein